MALISNDEVFMQEAIRQAKRAADQDEVPIGAVITYENRIIARAYNQVELLKDPTAHAEMIAITQATNFLGTKWLHNCCLYVTLEPCSMCAGALILSRIPRICFGALDPKAGACGSVANIVQHSSLNHFVEILPSVSSEICGGMLTEFFQKKRRQISGMN
ncbi:MAG: tRNA adenosine(34) deaminase TadA [Candidatus Omnitrophica bacterium]|nr:tRNA adenosine(34) deaminase TadA [Candidatus Omnitrophota bacterium]